MLDIFNGNAFSLVSLTDAINNLIYIPGRIGVLGLFTETGITTTSAAIEERDGQLIIVGPTPRGGPGHTFGQRQRRLRNVTVPHFEINDAVMAEQVQGVRAWGSETQVETVQGIVGERLQVAVDSFAATQEYSRVGAVKGIVTYADGTTTNLFQEFNVTQQAEVHLDLANSSPTPGGLRQALADIGRSVADTLGGLPYSGLYAFCGNYFFDKLIAHPDVRTTYLGWYGAPELRQSYLSDPATMLANKNYGVFPFGDIMWDNYRGKIGGQPFIEDHLAYIFPIGVPAFFRTYYAPADYIETVNTVGQRLYTKQYLMDNGKGVHLDSQMNDLELCTRPGALITATADS